MNKHFIHHKHQCEHKNQYTNKKSPDFTKKVLRTWLNLLWYLQRGLNTHKIIMITVYSLLNVKGRKNVSPWKTHLRLTIIWHFFWLKQFFRWLSNTDLKWSNLCVTQNRIIFCPLEVVDSTITCYRTRTSFVLGIRPL